MLNYPAWEIGTNVLPSRHVVGRLVVLECPSLFGSVNLHEVNSAIPRIYFRAGMNEPCDAPSKKPGNAGDQSDNNGELLWHARYAAVQAESLFYSTLPNTNR